MAYRPRPTTNRDTEFFWNGLRDGTILLQRCQSCDTVRHPARPMCPRCNSLEWDTVTASGRGTVYSYVIPRHPRFPFMDDPYVVVLVELEEGVRLVSNLCDVDPAAIEPGMEVEVFFAQFDDDLVLHQFRPGVAP
jgi:uncharacterized OB-fold protein